MSNLLRPPAVAGQFYEADGQRLAQQVEACFRSPRGPGELPAPRRSGQRRVRAIIVPHAGLVYSGPIAALAYAAVAAERPPEGVLILGVDHHGLGAPAALSDRDWAMPLGPVPTDHALVGRLHRSPVTIDESAHSAEHSIEVQLPFLDYVVPAPRFAALMIRHGPYDFLESVAEVVRRAVADRDVLLIASTDFSHYVAPATARRLDALALEQIDRRDARGLFDVVEREEISMCGIAPTTVLLRALADEPLTSRRLRWGHSGEAEPMHQVVGYASVLLESAVPLGPSQPK